MKNIFFKKNNNIKINDILLTLNLKKQKDNYIVKDIKDLDNANKNDISFFHTTKYLNSLKNTKCRQIITNNKYSYII